MPKPAQLPLAYLVIAGMLALFSGCGAESHSIAHIEGRSASISKPTLNHWMRALAGEDFRQGVGTTGPRGLVAEPANYAECSSAAKKLVPKTASGQRRLSEAQIAQKCHELYRSVKEQALSFLISAQWTLAEGAEQGVTVSSALLHSEFVRSREQAYPTEADLQRYLAERHWTLADLLYQLKIGVLVAKLQPKFEAAVKRAGGGERTYVKLALEHYKRLIVKTSCRPGYVVPDCKEYHGSPTGPPSGEVIVERFVQGRDG